AHLDQPLRRSDDALRRGLRGNVPAAAPGQAVAVLLAVSLPEHHERAAAIPQPAGVGRLRGFDLLHGFIAILVRRTDSRPGDAARPDALARRSGHLRDAGDGLAWFGAALEAVRGRLPAACRAGDAAGGVGPYGGQLRLLDLDFARMAFDDLPALLRRGRDLFGLRDGADNRHSITQVLRTRRFHHFAPPGQLRQGDACDRADRRLRLYVRDFSLLVQQGQVRLVYDAEQNTRALLDGLLERHAVQRRRPATALVAARPAQPEGAVPGLAGDQHGDVARTLHDHYHQPEPRFYALGVGKIYGYGLGLRDLHGDDRLLRRA